MGNVFTKPTFYTSDAAFDWLYPERMQLLSKRHWTPMGIAKTAARFLGSVPGSRVLDIGSGIGKFCLIGAYHYPESFFYGVEQRQELHHHALAAKDAIGLRNVEFMHANFTQIDVDDYDSFYFYNAFYENLDGNDPIDRQIAYSVSLYNYYSRYLFNVLHNRPSGTRLVTFHSLEDEVPPGYQLVDASVDLMLKMWIRR